MTIGILGNKIGMTQIFDNTGNRIPVTLINAGPCYITQIKTADIFDYDAIQIGYKNSFVTKKITKPEYGHLTKDDNTFLVTTLREFKVKNIKNYIIGDKIDLQIFAIGEKLNISAKTIGKGTTGNIKRNHFTRGPMSHGSKHHRLQGSLGAGTSPGRVFPGKKMSGHLGNTMCTLKNLSIIEIDFEKNLLKIKGSVPGKFGNLLYITKSE